MALERQKCVIVVTHSKEVAQASDVVLELKKKQLIEKKNKERTLMFRNAFAYITRKWSKSLLLLIIILLMSTLSLLGLAMRSATQEAASKSLGSIPIVFQCRLIVTRILELLVGLEILREKILKRLVRLKGLFRL